MNERMITMSICKDIPLEEFELIISPPMNRLASMCVNIYADGRFNRNGSISKRLHIRAPLYRECHKVY